MDLPNSLKGPLGSHQNYLVYIAFENFIEYDRLKKANAENNRHSTSDKYREFRLFLNSIESFNNVLEYFYFEFEDQISHSFLAFKKLVHTQYSILSDLEDMANAYKHCVRVQHGKKNLDRIWARDLQEPQLNLAIGLSQKSVKVEYQFNWPIERHEQKLLAVWNFWIDYHNRLDPQKLLLKLANPNI